MLFTHDNYVQSSSYGTKVHTDGKLLAKLNELLM